MLSAKNSINFLNLKNLMENMVIFCEYVQIYILWVHKGTRQKLVIRLELSFTQLISLQDSSTLIYVQNFSCQIHFIPRRYGPSSQCCNNRAMSLFLCYFFHRFSCKLFLPPQVFEERSVSQGGGDLPLRHRHWPLCESHRSPGQHCCIST